MPNDLDQPEQVRRDQKRRFLDELRRLDLDQKVRYERTLYVRCPISKTPYGVGVVTLRSGKESTVLACGKIHNLDQLPHYEGCDVNVWPTENGLKLKPLDQQPEETVNRFIESLEQGPDPEKAKAPELIEDSAPPAHPAAQDEHPAVPVLGELISYVARVAMAEGIPAAGWTFVPINQDPT